MKLQIQLTVNFYQQSQFSSFIHLILLVSQLKTMKSLYLKASMYNYNQRNRFLYGKCGFMVFLNLFLPLIDSTFINYFNNIYV